MEIIIKSWPVLTFFLLFQTTLYSRPLKFGAFNVKSFGIAKVERPHVLKSLTQILIRYDVVLLQEIRDKSLFAVEKLHESINKFSPYKVIVSSPDGRSRYKEQYAYFFREGYFEYFKSSVYPDPKDYFERNPFLLHIRPKSSKKGLFIIGAHIKPSDAVNEIKALEKVYAYGKKHFKEKDAIIMGDLNADCSYMNNNELDRAFFNTSDFFHSV
ncbi:MAG: endonuclease/exonuclease/phosphatase family protein, partial [Bdellovibrionota bacterium]|nr:endonuclease/exonuclease/phosphatase family protein [Bdellovibrionota bacterium]